jgi:hypothetical protein
MNDKQLSIQFVNSVNADLANFLMMLKGSLSLNLREKFRRLSLMPELSQKQVGDLLIVFFEEQQKYGTLTAVHPRDIEILSDIAQQNWELLCLKLDIPSNLLIH